MDHDHSLESGSIDQRVCYRHPDRVTGLSCSQCGRPICGECSIDAAVGQRCPTCVAADGTQRTIDPRRRSAPSMASAPVTLSVIGVAVGVYLLSFVAPGLYDSLLERLTMWNRAVAAGEWWRMFGVILFHASITHILFNMWAVYVFGPQIEREVGGLRFLALFLATAAAGSALAFHLGQIDDVGVGASGAIFGLFGVWLASAVRRRNTAYGRYLLSQLGFLLLINAALPLFIRAISWQAHLGGLIAGFLIGELWSRLGRTRGAAVHVAVAIAVAVASVGSVYLV